MKIRPISTESIDPRAGSQWLRHWEKHSAQTAVFCPVLGCVSTDLVGARVVREGSDQPCILPLCTTHQRSEGPLNVFELFALVPEAVAAGQGA